MKPKFKNLKPRVKAYGTVFFESKKKPSNKKTRKQNKKELKDALTGIFYFSQLIFAVFLNSYSPDSVDVIS